MKISEIRKQYPQYGDMSDQQLADSLHGKFYADMPKDEFYTKVGLTREHGVVDAFKGAYASAARVLNERSAGVLDKMSKGAKAVERWTGLPAGGAFEAGANTSRANAEFWRGKENEAGVDPNAITTKVYGGIGGAPIDIAEFSAGTPTAALSGLAEGGPLEALRSGVVRKGLGTMFKGLEKANLSPVQRSGAMAGTMAAQTAAEGGTVEDVVAAGLTGLALSSPTEGGRAGRVRQNLQRAGVQPEMAHDLASRPEVQPQGPGYVDTTNMDRALPGETALRPLVMDAEAAPRAVTVRPAERGPVLDAENPSRITREPMIPGGPGDAASMEVARLRAEHPDWRDADVWAAAEQGAVRNPEVLPTPTERDAQPVRREPVATAEDAPRPSPLNPPSMENPPVRAAESAPDVVRLAAAGDDAAYWNIRRQLENIVTREDIRSATPLLRRLFPEYTETAAPDSSNDYHYGIWRMANKGDEVGRIPTSELSRRIKDAVRRENAEGNNAGDAAPVGTPDKAGVSVPSGADAEPSGVRFNHDSLPTAAVTAADSLTVPASVKVAVVGTPAEISALVQPGKAVLRNGDKAYLIDRAEAAKQFGSLAEAKKMLLAGGDAEAKVLGYPSRPKGVPLTTEAVTKSGEILTDPTEIKQAASAGEVAYAAESTPAEVRAATERVAQEVQREQEANTTAGETRLPEQGVPEVQGVASPAGDGVPVLQPTKQPVNKKGMDRLQEAWAEQDRIAPTIKEGKAVKPEPNVILMNARDLRTGRETKLSAPYDGTEADALRVAKALRGIAADEYGASMRQSETFGTDAKGEPVYAFHQGEGETVMTKRGDPDAITLLHAGVHVPTLVKQVYDKYFRKLDADAAPGSVKEFLDKNRDANRKWGTEPIARWLRRAGIDQAANAQNELMRIGTPGEWARREFDAISGATAKAGLVKERMREQLGDLSLRERQSRADLVAIENDLGIASTGRQDYTFIGGFTPAELAAAKQTFQQDYKLSNAEMQRVSDSANVLMGGYKGVTQRLYESGMISLAEKTALDSRQHSPKQFLDKIDPFVSMHGPGGKVSVPDSGIHRLKEGSDAYFRNDPVALLEEAIDRTETRIARNDANKALAALPAGNGITEPAVRIGAKDWAEPPAGYETIRYMENGQQQAINVREDFAREWAQADPLVNSQLVNAIGWLSGASAVRAGSTGHNPLFAIANFPVDAMTIFLQADKRGYSPHAPVAVAQMARNVLSVAKDAWKHEGRYEQWVNEKGAREMLSNYGGVTSRRAHLSPLMQKVSDVTSKIGRFSEEVSRLAYREQLIKNGVAPAEASKIAGEYVDFSRGGNILKAIDRLGLPYLNAGVQGTRSVARAAGRDPAAFAYKAAQLLVGASALYGINQMINPTGWANVSDREKADNFIIMLPSYFNYTDKDGTTVTPYIRIKKEQSVRPLLSMAEALWQMTHEGKDATQQVEMAFDGAVPISPDKLLPPVAKMYLAYAANLDVYRKENVWKGKQEIEPYAEYTNNTNPILTRIGKETQVGGKGGVSPERLGRAVGQVIVPSNLFAKTGGALLTSAYEKMNPQERAEFGKTNYEKLVEFMKGTRLLGGAKDTEQFREGIREARVATNTQLFEMNKPLDAMVLKYAKEGMKDQAQYDKILAYIDSQPPEHRDRLESRMEDVIETANLPDRGWWLAVKALSPEDRADQFKARLEKVDPAEQERMMQIAEGLSGFTSERFWERYDGPAQTNNVP